MSDRLGGAVGRKPLHFIFVLDVSGSMLRGGRIQALNNAIAEVIPHLRDEAMANPHAELLVRVLAFATKPEWIVEQPTPIEQFHWQRLSAIPQGFTELGSALRVLAGTMRAQVLAASPVQEVRAPLAALADADAIFITSALIGLRPVSELDGRKLEPWPGLASVLDYRQ